MYRQLTTTRHELILQLLVRVAVYSYSRLVAGPCRRVALRPRHHNTYPPVLRVCLNIILDTDPTDVDMVGVQALSDWLARSAMNAARCVSQLSSRRTRCRSLPRRSLTVDTVACRLTEVRRTTPICVRAYCCTAVLTTSMLATESVLGHGIATPCLTSPR